MTIARRPPLRALVERDVAAIIACQVARDRQAQPRPWLGIVEPLAGRERLFAQLGAIPLPSSSITMRRRRARAMSS